ncbi:MAG: glycosyltransferase family protein [Planctomycetaceae bacterium]
MARIAISLCGEGRGHASRIATLLERMPPGHEVRIYAAAEGFEFLARRFPAGGAVRVTEIPGIVFQYTAGRLDNLRSIAAGFRFQSRQLGPLVDRLQADLLEFGADLAVTDFEPGLPRAAARLGIPLVSIDHQHFLRAYDLRSLPRTLQWRAWFIGLAVWLYDVRATDTVISAFFRPPLRAGWERVVQVGPLLRPEILAATPTRGDHLVSYLRRHTPSSAIEALAGCGMPVRIYGLGARDPVGGASFHDIDERRFVADLAGCRAVVSAAGNQLIGEALHLGKPMLLLPERAHVEQSINSHFLVAMGAGEFCHPERVSAARIREFVARLDRYSTAADAHRGRMDGTPAVLDVIASRLAAAR